MRTMSIARMGLPPVALAAGIASAMAGQFFPDQENLTTINSAWSAVYMAPVGQEFIPTATSMDEVEVTLANTDMSSPLPATVAVQIREGSITGPVLGTSDPLILEFGNSGVATFDFPSLVRLAPGTTYVLEIVVSPGGGNVGVSCGSTGEYAAGRAILLGEPIPSTDNSDLWFIEGSNSHGRHLGSK